MQPPKIPQATLLGLPTELRLQILEYYFTPSPSISIRHRNGVQFSSATTKSVYSILQTCKKIRSEALPLFYQSTRFNFRDGMTVPELREWVQVNRNKEGEGLGIRKVVLNCRGRCTMFGLQPDLDYCHRELHLHLDYYPEDEEDRGDWVYSSASTAVRGTKFVDLCSNRAFGCVELSLDGLMNVRKMELGREVMSGEVLIDLFLALSRDNSSSTA